MGKFLVQRLIRVPLVLGLLVTLTFFMVRLAPGGPFAGERQLDPAIQRALDAKYHLDESLPQQYVRFLGDLLLRGDLGPSFRHKGRSVNQIIARHAPTSIVLGLSALLLALTVGLTLGIAGGVKRNSPLDYGATSLSAFGLAVPTFVVGPLLALTFGVLLGWLPVAGYRGPTGVRHLILPACTLALPFAARIARLARAGIVEVIDQDYIRTARAKGLSEWTIVVRHALPGALLPVVGYLGPATAALLTGSLVVEQIFAIPGIGSEFVQGALNRDYTLVMGTVILYGVFIVILNLLADLAYGFLDPRIRYA